MTLLQGMTRRMLLRKRHKRMQHAVAGWKRAHSQELLLAVHRQLDRQRKIEIRTDAMKVPPPGLHFARRRRLRGFFRREMRRLSSCATKRARFGAWEECGLESWFVRWQGCS